MTLFFEVPVEPYGKGRARTFIHQRSGRPVTFTPEKTAAFEREVARAFRIAYPNHEPFTGPVAFEVFAFCSIPPSWPKWKREAALAGKIPHVSPPDSSNVRKAVEDALNKIAYKDDSQINDGHDQKRYASRPRVEVSITAGRE